MVQGDVVRVDGTVLIESLEKCADGVVGADAEEVDHGSLGESSVDFGAIFVLGNVGWSLGEHFCEPLLEGIAEEARGELNDAGGVLQNLHGLDPGDLVEEPATAGEHEQSVTLHLHQAEKSDLLFCV